MPGPRDIAPADLLRLLAVPLIWGVNNVAAKIAVDALPPMWSAALRFFIVLACLLWALRRPPAGRLWLFLALLACVGPVHFGILYTALGMASDLAPMIVAMQLWAPASVVFAALLLGERVGVLRWAGVGLAFAGVAGMTFEPAVFSELGALALASLASCFYGMGAVLVRRLSADMDAWAMQAWIALATAPTLAVASLGVEHGHIERMVGASALVWAAVVFGALASSLAANALLFRLVKTYEVSRTTPYMLLTPVVSFTLAAAVLGDQVTPQILAGAGLAMAGVALVALAERRRS